MDPVEQAKENFAQGYSCSQSVILAFAEELGMGREVAARVSAGFGGGMGRTGRTCGAVSGALMAIGLMHGGTLPTDKAAKEKVYQLARKLIEEFQAQRGAVDCRDLVGADISTPEGNALAREKGLFSNCAGHVEAAARIAAQLIK